MRQFSAHTIEKKWKIVRSRKQEAIIYNIQFDQRKINKYTILDYYLFGCSGQLNCVLILFFGFYFHCISHIAYFIARYIQIL